MIPMEECANVPPTAEARCQAARDFLYCAYLQATAATRKTSKEFPCHILLDVANQRTVEQRNGNWNSAESTELDHASEEGLIIIRAVASRGSWIADA